MIRRQKSEKTIDVTNPELEELQAKLSEAEAELAGYRSIQDITEVEIRELKKQLSEAESRLTFAPAATPSEDTSLLKDLLAARDREIASLRASASSSPDIDALKMRAGQADYLFAQLEAARSTISKLELEMLNQPHLSQSAFDEAFQRVRELEVELSRSHEDFDRSEELRRKAESDKSALQQELSELHQELESSKSGLASTEQLRFQVEELSSKLAGREQAVSELRKELSTHNARVVGTQAELDDLRQLRLTLEAENQNLKDEVANLKYELAESQTLKARLASAQIELEAFEEVKQAKHQLQDRVGILEGEILEAKSSAQEADALRQRVIQLQAEAANACELKDDLDYIRSLMSQALTRLNDAASAGSNDLPSFLAPLPKSAA